MSINTDAVQRLYVAYFNRPADPVGLAYWESQLSSTVAATQAQLTTLAAGFSGSAEYAALYAGQTDTQIVSNLYLNLFGREAEPAGLVFWASKLTAGTETFASIALQLTYSAQGTDAAAIANKLAAANAFTTSLDTTEEIVGYSGTAAAASARTYLAAVTDAAATLAAAVAGVDAAIAAAIAAVGATIILTTGLDEVNITTANTVDRVNGYYANGGTDTFNAGDTINGNGLTVVRLVVDENGYVPYVEMSGVDKLNIVAAAALNISMDANNYGADISGIVLSGADHAQLNVYELAVEGSLGVSFAAATHGDIYASGTADGVGISVSLASSDADSVGAVASIGSAGISATLGESDDAWLYYYQTASESAAAVSVGDLNVGSIDLNVGASASVAVTVTNWAHNTGTGSATVGNLTFGDINIVAAADSSAIQIYAYNSATADSGDATVGNLTVGNVDIVIGDGATGMSSFFFYNSAEATNGNATAGDITFGNIQVDGGTYVEYGLYGYIYNSAFANITGNAEVGNITIGDIDIALGNDSSSATVFLSNYAVADEGTATAGNIVVGDVNMAIGNNLSTSGSLNFTANNYAYVIGTDAANAATVGSITIGDVNMTAGSDNSATFSVSNWAYTPNGGAATAGAVTIGNVTGSVGIDGSFDGWVGVYAYGTSGDTVGNVKIGNIDLYGGPDADLEFSVNVYADNGTVSDVTIGNIDMTVDNDGSVSFELDMTGDTVGDIKIGDVSLTLGDDASIDTFSISVSARTGDIASFTIGDVTIIGADDSYDDNQGFTIAADNDIGNIKIGDVTVTAGESASFTSMVWYFEARNGSIGNITMGDTDLTAGENANNWRYVNFTADDEIGNVSVGDITLSAAKSASAWLEHDYSASDDIGNVVYGNISNVAIGATADAGFSFDMSANGETIGTVTFGNIDLTAAGHNAWAGAFIYLSDTGDTVGLATVGDITLNGSNTILATRGADVSFTMYSNGSIKVGDIAVAAGAVTALFVDSATVEFDLDIGTGNNLTVGNITVTGGFVNDPDGIPDNGDELVLDNLGVLTNWMNLYETGSGSITVGNVDYSGYEAAATIDVSAFETVGTITAAQDDTNITLNTSTKNVVILGAGDDTVDVGTGGTLKLTAAVIDVINNFTTGSDVIEIDTTGDFDFDFVSLAAANYAAFLVAADAAMSGGTDIYVGKVGSDLYLAVDQDTGGAVDFVIKLAGISTVVSGDFVSI